MRSDKQKEMSGHEDDTDVSGINCKEQESTETKCREKGKEVHWQDTHMSLTDPNNRNAASSKRHSLGTEGVGV